MPNYEMKFSVSEAARSLGIERELIKRLAYLFCDYLKPLANPPKGHPRQFCAEDLRVLAYVSMYWEDDPDIESIKCGLNSEDHYEEIYDNLITEVSPLFIDPPEELNEDWRHGTIMCGLAEFGDAFALADSYKLAGDVLVDAALSNNESFDLIYPIIFNYRHATELYMKSTTGRYKKNHNLLFLLQEFKQLLRSEFDSVLPDWFENVILAFNDFDPKGTAFRYGGDIPREVWADLVHIKKLMSWIAESFQKIKNQRHKIKLTDAI